VFLHCLNLELELRQISLQFGDLFSFGLVAALNLVLASAAVTAAGRPTVTISVLAITVLVTHFSLLKVSRSKVVILCCN
jgi:hypothetical protein